jgi:hypothetical protein
MSRKLTIRSPSRERLSASRAALLVVVYSLEIRKPMKKSTMGDTSKSAFAAVDTVRATFWLALYRWASG